MIVLAQVSDLHIDGTDRSVERARRVMAYLKDLTQPIDGVLVTGDLADNGTISEYETVREVLRSPYPLMMCPGNHDVRTNYRKVLLGDDLGERPVNQVHRLNGGTVVLCDSSIPGRAEGYLDDETIGWLSSELARASGPVFVAMHHPPVTLTIPYVDEIRLRQASRLSAVLERSPQVVAVLVGHAHTAATTTFAGLPLVVAPSTSSTCLLPWERGPVISYEPPPAVAFHVYDDGRLTTHYRVVN